jgi:hypothetical protein
MSQNTLLSSLVNWSVEHSGYDPHRSYLGLSSIADCPVEIYDRYMHGGKPNGVTGHLLTRLSYELEGVLIQRLSAMQLYQPAPEIAVFNGLVRGHPDGFIGPDLLEIKTLAHEEHIPTDGRVPRRIYWQVQAYLHYTNRMKAQVLYLARANGALEIIPVSYNQHIAAEIIAKLETLVDCVQALQRPACTCGRCEPVLQSQQVKDGK